MQSMRLLPTPLALPALYFLFITISGSFLAAPFAYGSSVKLPAWDHQAQAQQSSSSLNSSELLLCSTCTPLHPTKRARRTGSGTYTNLLHTRTLYCSKLPLADLTQSAYAMPVLGHTHTTTTHTSSLHRQSCMKQSFREQLQSLPCLRASSSSMLRHLHIDTKLN
jgi:hypothetical protein